MTLSIRSEAREELDAAMAFYESRELGLGLRFLDAVSATIEQASEYPESGEAVGGALTTYGARRFVVRGFPYTVYVATVGGTPEVFAIAHMARRPGYWKDRL